MNPPLTPPCLLVGCGYVGSTLVRYLLAAGVETLVTVRSDKRAHSLAELGVAFMPLDLDGEDPHLEVNLDGWNIIYFVPPNSDLIYDLRVTKFLKVLKLSGQPRKMIYISTTAVYGDHQGGIVTEETPVNPQLERGCRRLDAERQWQVYAEENALPWVVLRLSGIYGPGKLPIKRLQQQQPILSLSESGYSNRIHLEDLIEILCRVLSYPQSKGIYNVADGYPSSMSDYLLRVAKAAGIAAPPQISLHQAQQQLSATMLSYLSESRRIDNRRLLNDLQLTLKYSNLDQGISASLNEG